MKDKCIDCGTEAGDAHYAGCGLKRFSGHWLKDLNNLSYYVKADFNGQLDSENILEPTSQITLQDIIERSKKAGKKVCLVVYENEEYLSGSIFEHCWQKMGSPRVLVE